MRSLILLAAAGACAAMQVEVPAVDGRAVPVVVPTDGSHLVARAQTLLQSKEFASAVPLLQAALAVKQDPATLHILGETLIQMGNLEDATVYLLRARQLGLPDTTILKTLVLCMINHASHIFHGGRMFEAQGLFRLVETLRPNHMYTNFHMMQYEYLLGDGLYGPFYGQRALEQEPDNLKLLNSLGTFSLMQGDYSSALREYIRAIDVWQQDTGAYSDKIRGMMLNVAIAQKGLGLYDNALSQLEQLRKGQTMTPQAHFQLAHVLLVHDRKEDAFEQFQAGLEIHRRTKPAGLETTQLDRAYTFQDCGRTECPPTVYVYCATNEVTGGPQTLHHLHHTLNRLGYRSLIFRGNPVYATEHSKFIEAFDVEKLRPVDTVVVGEMSPLVGKMALRAKLRGARIVTFFLGQARYDLEDLVTPHRVPLCSTSYFAGLFGCPLKAILTRPMEAVFYETAKEAKSYVEGKENVVLYDGDFSFKSVDFSLYFDYPVEFVQLSGFSQPELMQQYRRAKVLIDLRMTGPERVCFESSLFDTIVLVPKDGASGEYADFPIAREHKIDMMQLNWMDALMRKVRHYVDNYEELLPEFRPMKDHARHLNNIWVDSVDNYFANDVLFVTTAFSQDEVDMIPPFLVALLNMYPHASVEIFVTDVAVVRNHLANALFMLRQRGWLNFVRISALPSDLRPYGSNALYMVQPLSSRRKYTCFIDVKTLVLGDGLILRHRSMFSDRRPFLNRGHARLDSSLHVVVSDDYFPWMAAWDGVPLSAALPSMREMSRDDFLTKLMTHVYGQDSVLAADDGPILDVSGFVSLAMQGASVYPTSSPLSSEALFHLDQIRKTFLWRSCEPFFPPMLSKMVGDLVTSE